MKRLHGLAALALVGALVSCAAPPPAAIPPAPSPTGSPAEPSPTPAPTVEPLAIPDCEVLLPLALAQESFSAYVQFDREFPASEYVPHLSVPSVPMVLADADPAKSCSWGIPNSDGRFTLVVAEVTEGERATLQAELTAAGYARAATGTVTTFELGDDSCCLSYASVVHLFAGDVWVLADTTSSELSAIVTGSALDALRSANPTLSL